MYLSLIQHYIWSWLRKHYALLTCVEIKVSGQVYILEISSLSEKS